MTVRYGLTACAVATPYGSTRTAKCGETLAAIHSAEIIPTSAITPNGKPVSYSQDHPVKCKECDDTYPGSKWHAIKSWRDGWYQFRDGTALCPEHRPEWAR